MKRKQTDSMGRRAMKLLCKLLGAVFTVMLCGTLAFQYFLKQIDYVDPSPETESDSAAFFTPVDLENVISGLSQDRIGGTGSGLLNILLIGQDRREGEAQARSDTMILCTFNKTTKKLTMTSFLRDLYVQIPGRGSNRINAAYAEGGMPLLKQTLEENFGLHIDGIVEVDFAQFSGIVDLLGGVEIDLRKDEAKLINKETGSKLSEGTQRLNGTQALAYSRIRKLDADGDFSRTSRQRKVITALLQSYRSVQLNDMVPLIKQILPMITTDMSNGQILLCAMEVLPSFSRTQIVSQHIPADGTYENRSINGMSVLVADMDAARAMLRESLLESN